MWLFLAFLIGYIGGSVITAMVAFRRSSSACSDEDWRSHAPDKLASEPVPFAPLHPGLPDAESRLRWSSFPSAKARLSMSANSPKWHDENSATDTLS